MHTPVPDSLALRCAGWIATLVAAGIGSSIIFACATPFAALATRIGSAQREFGRVPSMLASFAAAFAGYEIVLYVATAVLPSDPSAFSPAVVLYFLKVNAVAFGGLLLLRYAGVRTGLVLPQPSRGVAPTVA
jgi:hypothetical protein